MSIGNKFLTAAMCVAIIPLSLTLSACSTATQAIAVIEYTTRDFFKSDEVNLSAKNYAAGDYLVQQIDEYISPSSPISTQALTLVGEPAITSELGATITQQVGERLSQLGYEVIPSPSAAGYVHGVNPSPKHERFTLGGTYDTQKHDVLINLRVVRNSDGKIVGRFDYQMPRSGELRALSESKAQIIRVK